MSGEKINKRSKSIRTYSFKDFVWCLRPLNLFIVAITQITFYKFLFVPLSLDLNRELVLNNYLLWPFTVTTVIITACGYLINDYFDFEGDQYNNKRYRLSYKWLYLPYYFVLLILGLCLSVWIALELNNLTLVLYYLGASVMLFLYSSYFKLLPLIGNLIVAVFSAFVLFIIALFEYTFMLFSFIQNEESVVFFHSIFVFYLFFMFFKSWIREMVKDLEDVYGDTKVGAQTLAVNNKAKAKELLIISAILLLLIEVFFLVRVNVNSVLCLFLIVVPQILFSYKLLKAEVKKHFTLLSKLAKINMILGLCFLVLLQYM